MTGIDVSGRIIILEDLHAELETGGVPVPNGLSIAGPGSDPVFPPQQYPPLPQGSRLFTYDANGNPVDLPPEADPIVAAYTPAVP